MEKATPENTQNSPKAPSSASMVTNRIQIFLVNDEETQNCQFWIGLFAKGPHSPNHLFYKESLMDVFESASKEGLSEAVPVMLSDTTKAASKYIYLLPTLDSDALAKEEWIHNTIQAVKACQPKTIGIYLSPEAMADKSKSDDSLRQVLKAIIKETDVQSVALFPGDYGTNSVLNVALSIKAEVQSEVLVYH